MSRTSARLSSTVVGDASVLPVGLRRFHTLLCEPQDPAGGTAPVAAATPTVPATQTPDPPPAPAVPATMPGAVPVAPNPVVQTPAAPVTAQTPAVPAAPAPAPAAVPATAPAVQTPAPAAAPAADPHAGLISAVQAAVTAQVAPIQEQMNAINTRLDAATQTPPAPRAQSASTLYGAAGQAPAIRQGENTMSSRGYEFGRAIGFLQGQLTADQAGVEIQASNFLRQSMMQYGFAPKGRADGALLVPLFHQAIPQDIRAEFNRQCGDMNTIMTQAIGGMDGGSSAAIAQKMIQMQNLDPMSMEAAMMRQQLSIFDDSAMGIFTTPGPHGELIQLLRNAEVLSQWGASQQPLPPNGYLPYGRMIGDATADWVGENQSISTSEPTTGNLHLQARTLASRVNSPNQLLMFGGPEVELQIRASMVVAAALKLDLAGFEGTGSTTQPIGIRNLPGKITHTSSVTQAANGDTFNPETPGAMIAELTEVNHDPENEPTMGFVMRGKMWWDNLMQRRADAVSAGDKAGPFLFTVNNEDISAGRPSRLHGKRLIISNQINKTTSKGSSSDLSYVVAGIGRHNIIGRVGVAELARQVEGDTVFANNQTGLRLVQYVDIGHRYENAFVIADTIDMDLPA